MRRTLIAYSPPPQPDELLYSWLGRLAALSALGSPSQVMTTLYGDAAMIPSIDLPSRLETLQDRLAEASPWDSLDELLDSATIYPYYRAFLPPERNLLARERLLRGDVAGLKNQLGLVANRFGAMTWLSFCARCLQQDARSTGVLYWRRAHHLPGVTSCPVHGVQLSRADVLPPPRNRQQLMLPTRTMALTKARAGVPRLIDFSKLSSQMLEAKLIPHEPWRRQACYERAALDAGFGGRKGRVAIPELARALRVYYDDFRGFVHRERLLATQVEPLRWLKVLIEQPCVSAHPICHLLLLGYLFASIDEYKKALSEVSESRGNWTLESNTLTTTTRESRPSSTAIISNGSMPHREGEPRLSRSIATVATRRRLVRIAVGGSSKRQKASTLAAISKALTQGASPMELARKSGLSLGSVYRLRQRLPAIARNGAARGGLHPSRVNWAARDSQIASAIARTAITLKADPKAPRVSKSMLIRLTGASGNPSSRGRLPETKSALERHAESHADFRARTCGSPKTTAPRTQKMTRSGPKRKASSIFLSI